MDVWPLGHEDVLPVGRDAGDVGEVDTVGTVVAGSVGVTEINTPGPLIDAVAEPFTGPPLTEAPSEIVTLGSETDESDDGGTVTPDVLDAALEEDADEVVVDAASLGADEPGVDVELPVD